MGKEIIRDGTVEDNHPAHKEQTDSSIQAHDGGEFSSDLLRRLATQGKQRAKDGSTQIDDRHREFLHHIQDADGCQVGTQVHDRHTRQYPIDAVQHTEAEEMEALPHQLLHGLCRGLPNLPMDMTTDDSPIISGSYKDGHHGRNMVLAAIVAADGLGSNGLPQPLGFCWLDFMDLWSEGIMMPLGVMLMALCVGYEIKVSSVEKEIAQNGNQFTTKSFFTFCIKYVVPLAMVLILAGQIDTFFALGLFS